MILRIRCVYAEGIMAKHTDEEIEIFAQELAITDDPNAAYMKAKPNTKAKPQSVYSLSCRMAKLPEVVKRVAELKSQIKVKAESKFSITVEQRLEWLKEIVEAGLGTYIDQQGNSRREGLAAARASIQTMNDMLGVADGDDSQSHQGLTIVIKKDSRDNKSSQTDDIDE